MANKGLSRWIAMLVAVLILLPVPARADSANFLLNRFYDLRQTDPAAARAALETAIVLYPTDPRAALELGYFALAQGDRLAALAAFQQALTVQTDRADLWAQIGYIQIDLQQPKAALSSFKEARRLAPDNADYAMQADYLELQLHDYAAARRDFRQLAFAGGARAAEACANWRMLEQHPGLALPAPWFSEMYMAPEYRRRQDVSLFPVELRLGAAVAPQVEAYGSLRATIDNRSEGGSAHDGGPVVVFDDAAILAGGIRARPWMELPVSFFAEAGIAHDLNERGRPRDRGDLRGGALLYRDWNMQQGCAAGLVWPLRPIADLYGEAIYFSRYDDLLVYLRGRPGLRMAEMPAVAVDAYLLLAAGYDVLDNAGNRYLESGLGTAWHLHDPAPLTARAEMVQAWPRDGADYLDLRLRLEYAVRF